MFGYSDEKRRITVNVIDTSFSSFILLPSHLWITFTSIMEIYWFHSLNQTNGIISQSKNYEIMDSFGRSKHQRVHCGKNEISTLISVYIKKYLHGISNLVLAPRKRAKTKIINLFWIENNNV